MCRDAGVLTSDPRIVSDARPVPLLTYDEAAELAFFGATVLHPSAMQPAYQTTGLDVRVKNSYNRSAGKGLLLTSDRHSGTHCFSPHQVERSMRLCIQQSNGSMAEATTSIVYILGCRNAAGTLIARERDMSCALMTSIVLKTNVTLMDIVSTRMLGQFGFLSKVSSIGKQRI